MGGVKEPRRLSPERFRGTDEVDYKLPDRRQLTDQGEIKRGSMRRKYDRRQFNVSIRPW